MFQRCIVWKSTVLKAVFQKITYKLTLADQLVVPFHSLHTLESQNELYTFNMNVMCLRSYFFTHSEVNATKPFKLVTLMAAPSLLLEYQRGRHSMMPKSLENFGLIHCNLNLSAITSLIPQAQTSHSIVSLFPNFIRSDEEITQISGSSQPTF